MVDIPITDTLSTEQCCQCGMTFAMPKIWQTERRRDHASFYCPAGHPQRYIADSAEERLEREVNRLKQDQARLVEERQAALARAVAAAADAERAAKAHKRTLKRVRNGTCPDCNRSFADLGRHMHSKHGKLIADVAA